jgi:hypothetical protein
MIDVTMTRITRAKNDPYRCSQGPTRVEYRAPRPIRACALDGKRIAMSAACAVDSAGDTEPGDGGSSALSGFTKITPLR